MTAWKKYTWVALFVLVQLYGKSQAKRVDAGKLLVKLSQSKPDTGRVRVLLQLSTYYFDQLAVINRMDSAEFYLKEAEKLNKNFRVTEFQNSIQFLYAKRYCIEHPTGDPKLILLPVIESCKKTGDKHTGILAWKELGSRAANDSSSLQFKITCYQNALTLARESGDGQMEVRMLGNIAAVHIREGKLDLAESESLQILKDEIKAGPFYLMVTCDVLTKVYTNKGVYVKALEYALKTQHWMGVCGDSAAANIYFQELSEVYHYLGKSDESLYWAKKSLDREMAINNAGGAFAKVDNIAYLLLEQGKAKEALAFLLEQLRRKKPVTANDQRRVQEALGNAYNALGMYKQAEESYLEMLRLGNAQATNYTDNEKGYDHLISGSFYFNRGNFGKALPLLEKALKHYETDGQPAFIKLAHHWLFRTDSALNYYNAAIYHLKESHRFSDSIFTIARSKQVEELQVAYQTEQKDKSIRLLDEKEKLARIQLQHTRSTRSWVIAGAFMLLIIAALLYRLAGMRKKNNRIITDKNKQLQHLLTEKEWLLKEVHHRVKNNLHTVIGLLESQANYLQDDALKANEISKHRIYAMSLIHQQLYKAQDIKSIDMSVFLPELLEYLGESFGTARKIQFRRNIEPVRLGVSQAIPVALIVNEAVTNSIKYAFPGGEPGIINISMYQSSERIILVVSDNGTGIDPGIIKKQRASMGLNLMKGLTGEMDGQIYITNENGTRITINFSPDALNEFSQRSTPVATVGDL
ncbi:MAG: histidine kinase dimerization/phosphoacceptor domain -containing protein [Bacteroidota bacterium]